MFYNVNNKRSMENTELKNILIAYKSTNIGLQQAHDEILRLFSVVGRSYQLKCQCKNAQFTRTVDANGNPLCGRCGKAL